jgi:hypothetical protein
MSGNTNPGGQTTAATATTPAAAFSQSDIDQARAAGVAEGSKAERDRVGSILTHEKAGANMALAVQCVNSGLTTEQAGAILGTAPAQFAVAEAKLGNAFAAAMAATGNPQVSGVEASAEMGNKEAALAGQILAAFSLGGKARA